MKKVIVTSIALAMSVSVSAQSLDIANDRPVVAPAPQAATLDTVIGAAAGTSVVAGVASWALPAAVAHSSGAAIVYSGAGYVAGTMGLAAGTIAALPFIAAGAAAVGGGAIVYKYYGEEIDTFVQESVTLIEEYTD